MGWGQKIIPQLTEDLQKEFSRNSGFSYANLDRMRKFHLSYKDEPKLAQVVREIPWGQNITVLEKLKDNYQREYYLRMTIRSSWRETVPSIKWNQEQLSSPSVIEDKLRELEEKKE